MTDVCAIYAGFALQYSKYGKIRLASLSESWKNLLGEQLANTKRGGSEYISKYESGMCVHYSSAHI